MSIKSSDIPVTAPGCLDGSILQSLISCELFCESTYTGARATFLGAGAHPQEVLCACSNGYNKTGSRGWEPKAQECFATVSKILEVWTTSGKSYIRKSYESIWELWSSRSTACWSYEVSLSLLMQKCYRLNFSWDHIAKKTITKFVSSYF